MPQNLEKWFLLKSLTDGTTMEDLTTTIILIAASISGSCLSMAGYFLHNKYISPTKIQNNKINDIELDAYKKFLMEANIERKEVLHYLSESHYSKILKPSNSANSSNFEQRFFMVPNQISVEYQRQEVEAEELVEQLFLGLELYPDFCLERALSEPGYIRQIHQETAEHHIRVMTLAEEFFKRADIAKHRREQLVTFPMY